MLGWPWDQARRRARSPRRSAVVVVGAIVATIATPVSFAAAAPVLLEAEGAVRHGAVLEAIHAGHTGTGYVNFDPAVDSWVEWTLATTTAARADVTFRYANGTTADRPMAVWVNGVLTRAAVSFPATGAWSQWRTTSIVLPFVAGTNVVRAASTTTTGGPNLDSMAVTTTPIDWSRAVADATMARTGPAPNLGIWSYKPGFYLWGQYLLYQRTGDSRYLTYLRSWVDAHVSPQGVIDQTIHNLDAIQPGNLLLVLASQTTDTRYGVAADGLRRVLETYPRTSDGAFWHGVNKPGELWLDGVYMATPFLVRDGQQRGTPTWVDIEGKTRFHAPVRTTPSGFTGTGYVDFADEIGSYVEWRTTGIGGPANLTFRYANGTTQPARLDVRVNGVTAANVAFAPTGSWSTWREVATSIPIGPGTNTIRATSSTTSGGPNLDRVRVDDATSDGISQLRILASHLQTASGVLLHAWDEQGDPTWPIDASTHRSPAVWGRALGWYAMALVDVLSLLPPAHPARSELVGVLVRLADALARTQDPRTGRWYQVVDQPAVAGNWLETSSSAMFTYALTKAVRAGWIDPSYGTVAARGYQGVLSTLTFASDGAVSVIETSIGTDVGSRQYYLDRPRAVNEIHGLGAFLVMDSLYAPPA